MRTTETIPVRAASEHHIRAPGHEHKRGCYHATAAARRRAHVGPQKQAAESGLAARRLRENGFAPCELLLLLENFWGVFC